MISMLRKFLLAVPDNFASLLVDDMLIIPIFDSVKTPDYDAPAPRVSMEIVTRKAPSQRLACAFLA